MVTDTLITHGSMLLVIGFLIALYILELRHNRKERQMLLDRLMAKDLDDYATARTKLDTTPKDYINQLKTENELAENAARMVQERSQSGPFPVT